MRTRTRARVVLPKCPECFSTSKKILKVHNPETTSMNADATFECLECNNVWEGHVLSDKTKEARRRGFIRI